MFGRKNLLDGLIGLLGLYVTLVAHVVKENKLGIKHVKDPVI
jgi:hypothetical protein